MEYKQVNDYEALYLVKDCDENAYGIFFLKYKPILVNFAKKYKRMYYNSGIEFDDLYQEGMIGLNDAIKNFNTSGYNTFYTFAVLCIKRAMQKLVIKSVRGKSLILNSAYSFEDEIIDGGVLLKDTLFNENDNTEEFFEKKCNYEEILQYKYFFKENQMAVYEMKLNGFSNKDIACLLGLTYKDVDNCLYSIRKFLKKRIKYGMYD